MSSIETGGTGKRFRLEVGQESSEREFVFGFRRRGEFKELVCVQAPLEVEIRERPREGE